MPFWEDLTRKVSAESQEAARQAQTLAETTRLNGQIEEKKRELEKLYRQIGEAYCTLHSEGAEGAMAAPVAAVCQARQALNDLQANLRALRQVSLCPGCGAEVSYVQPNCPRCGSRVPHPGTARQKCCPYCGMALTPGAKFCVGCGRPAEISGTAAPAQPPAFCRACGAALEPDAKFCPRCGGPTAPTAG